MNIFFVSLGCDKNLVDSEIMLGIINEDGHKIVLTEEEADIIIINTCGFILDATEEGIQNILEIGELKKEGIIKGIIVTGCMAQRYEEEIFKELPEVDAVVGTADFEKIGEVINQVIAGNKNIKFITDKNKTLDNTISHKRILSTPNYFAYLKISEGCDNKCTYCTIPSLRGKYRSRELESLIKETEILANQGVKEIVLVAQDTSLYGTDLYEKNMLHVLLRRISEIEGIEWIRIMYCYPEHITDETIEEIAINKKVCHYLDMPIQHSENKILKLMNRKNTKEGLFKIIKKLRNKIPDLSLRTTLIVGFPGETEEDFYNLVDFIKEIKFDKLGVFSYSKEEGTPAFKLPNQIKEEIKEDRKKYILDVQQNISREENKKHIGKVFQIIVEGRLSDEENIYCGRSYRDAYEVDGITFFESKEEIISGEFLNIKIENAEDYDLWGVIENELGE